MLFLLLQELMLAFRFDFLLYALLYFLSLLLLFENVHLARLTPLHITVLFFSLFVFHFAIRHHNVYTCPHTKLNEHPSSLMLMFRLHYETSILYPLKSIFRCYGCCVRCVLYAHVTFLLEIERMCSIH